MTIYIVVIMLTTLTAHFFSKARKSIIKKPLFVLLIIIPSLFSGLRGVGTDYLMLINNNDRIINSRYYAVDYSSLWIQLLLLGGRYRINPQVLILLCSLFTVGIAFWIFRIYEKYISFSFAVFSFMTSFYLLSFNLYRQLLANEILFLGIVLYATEKSKIKYWICGILSAWIHSSCILFLPIIFVWNLIVDKKYKNKRTMVYIIGLALVFSIPFFSRHISWIRDYFPHYEYYFRSFSFQGFGTGFLRYLILAVVPAIYYQRSKRYDKLVDANMEYLIFFSIFGSIIWLTSYISDAFIYRISFPMLVALPLLHGLIAKDIRCDNKNIYKRKGLLYIMLSVLAISVFFYYDFVIVNSGLIIPYKFFWEI